MEKRGQVDVQAKLRGKNNFKSKHEITLVELSASDVEILDEGSHSWKEIKIDEEYRKEEAMKRKRACGGRNQQKTLPRSSSFVRKDEAGHSIPLFPQGWFPCLHLEYVIYYLFHCKFH